MLFVVFPRHKKYKQFLNAVKKIYSQKNLLAEEYVLGDEKYIVCYTDPREILPDCITKKLVIEKASITDIKKTARYRSEDTFKEKLKKGVRVVFIKGSYRGMKGIVEKVEGREVKVIIPVFGHPFFTTVNIEEVIPEGVIETTEP